MPLSPRFCARLQRSGLTRIDIVADLEVERGWRRVGTIAESRGDGTSVASWNRTCSTRNLHASPWAPFPVFDDDPLAEGGGSWHVHWVSYSCDLSWPVRVGTANILGAVSSVPGIDGVAGPYVPYPDNGVVIGPNASGARSTRWGDLTDCAGCHGASSPPVYCAAPPCQFDNGITGAAISTGPYALPSGAPARFATFLGLGHSLAWSDSMTGPWTVGTPFSTGQLMNAKMSTPSCMYTENPVTTSIRTPDGRTGYVAVFDTVEASGGWVPSSIGGWTPGGRGEAFGFGVVFSLDGMYWSDGVDVALPGGCRTPLGLIEEPGGGFSLLFTRRFKDCRDQTLPHGSRGDAANDRTMCANLYAARFNVSWADWE